MQIGQPFNPYRMFVGIFIPNVLLSYPDLSASAKLCYGRLCQYAGENGQAYPTYKKLASELGVSKRTCIRYINELADKEFVRVVTRAREDSSQTSNVYEFLWHEIFATQASVSPPSDNMITPVVSELSPLKENHLKESLKYKTYSSADDKDKIPYQEIIDLLNKHSGKRYLSTTAATREKIKARWEEGFRISDFEKVIKIKCSQWKDDPEMQKYLRPITLFSPKFEGYLNENEEKRHPKMERIVDETD